jgi:uncharacterized protein YdeI (YjbR/CyaY-like superfamily)
LVKASAPLLFWVPARAANEARAAYDGLSFTYRKEWVRWVEEAKKPETRASRIEKTVAGLRAGKKTH